MNFAAGVRIWHHRRRVCRLREQINHEHHVTKHGRTWSANLFYAGKWGYALRLHSVRGTPTMVNLKTHRKWLPPRLL